MRTIALIGDPVSQSPSPAMHRAAFAETGLDLDYVAERVTREELPHSFDRLRERFAGLNVTRPLKESIVPLLDEVRGEAAANGSVNTVAFKDGRSIGDSTDGAGFLAALERAGAPLPRFAVILGSGGSARAVGGALRRAGAHVVIAARNEETRTSVAAVITAEATSLEEAAQVVASADLLVNTTPLGERSPLPAGVELHPGLAVFDIVYAPRVTRLLEEARGAGCLTIEGVDLLVEQGALSFEIWTGVRPPIDVMREAAIAELEQGAGV